MSETILRRINMIGLIPRHPAKTYTNEIKGKLDDLGYDTTLRTIQRDLHELSRFFPIVSDERSYPFGWSWKKDAKGYESPAMDPIQALTFSLAAQYLEPLMPKSNFKRIEIFFDRAESVLTGNEKSKLNKWRNRVRVIPENIRFKEPKINLDIRQKLYRAVYEGVQIKTYYRKRGNKVADQRHMHPLGIVIKGSMHYLICMMDEDPLEPRYLPLQRFEKVELLSEKTNEPKNFNLDKFLHKNNLGFAYSDKLYTFEAIFDKTMAFHLLETPLNNSQKIKELEDDRLLIKARVPDTLQFEQWLMSFGSNVEILKPKKLRNKFKLLANDLIKKYNR
ncbi:WYL domain-containing protein [Gammaproteobacteria bacterium]|nr:WYL domain-containing protein [Gammaproteobacteria bacterium]